MSGVGEVIAIVGCVAGLIQAIDAGHNIVKQIKERRQARRANGALPPSERLEETLEQGKKDIEKLVERGQRRFGENFEVDETARIAIMQITIQIQNALLNRLTQARSDDSVVDFDECIDLSDQGCTDALVALQELYQRKLKDDMGRKQVTQPAQPLGEVQSSVRETNTASRVVVSKPQMIEANIGKPRASKTVAESEQPASSKRTKARVYSFRRRPNNETESEPCASVQPSERSGTAMSLVTPDPGGDTPGDRSSLHSFESRTPSGSHKSPDSASVTTPTAEASESSWKPGMSRASTAATIASVVTTAPLLAKDSGTCKNANKVREKGIKAGLMPVNLSTFGQNWVYQCKSTKCRFHARTAKDNKRSVQIDNEVYRRHGVEYRWTFLAKSHIAYNGDASEWPYHCLLCLTLQQESEIYYTQNDLFQHISQHSEKTIGRQNVNMRGPLLFNKTDVETNEEFDIRFSDTLSSSASTTKAKSVPPAKFTQEVRQKLSSIVANQEIRVSEQPAFRAEGFDLLLNPWQFK